MVIQQKHIPKAYAYCFAGKDSCPQAETCLRAIAAKLLTESENAQPQTVHMVNSIYLEQLTDLDMCPLYRSNRPQRYGKGMKHLFDEIPFKKITVVRSRVVECFSCERYYYNSRNGTRLINLEEQEKIANVFKSVAPGQTPKYDDYEYVIEW